MHKEGSGGGFDEPLQPFELPEELKEFLRMTGENEYVLVPNASNEGTVYVVKASEPDIASVRGNVLMRVTHEVHEDPDAPVIRSLVMIYDDPLRALALETFTN